MRVIVVVVVTHLCKNQQQSFRTTQIRVHLQMSPPLKPVRNMEKNHGRIKTKTKPKTIPPASPLTPLTTIIIIFSLPLPIAFST